MSKQKATPSQPLQITSDATAHATVPAPGSVAINPTVSDAGATIVTSVRQSLSEGVREEIRKQRQQHLNDLTAYAEIIGAPAGSLPPEETSRLMELVKKLGITPDQVEADIKAVERFAHVKRVADDNKHRSDALYKRFHAGADEFLQLEKTYMAAKEDRMRLIGEANSANIAAANGHNEANRIVSMNRRAFGQMEPPKEPQPVAGEFVTGEFSDEYYGRKPQPKPATPVVRRPVPQSFAQPVSVDPDVAERVASVNRSQPAAAFSGSADDRP